MHPVRWTAALTLVALVPIATAAQEVPRVGEPSPALLRRSEVQAELKLTEQQKKTVDALYQKLQEKNRVEVRAYHSKVRGLTPEEHARLLEEWRTRRLEEAKEGWKALEAVLNPDQQKRFGQVTLQRQGLRALATFPEAFGTLNLTDAQKGKLRAISQQRLDGRRDAFRAGSLARQNGDKNALNTTREKVQALDKDAAEKMYAVLTDEQKAKWKEMLGPEVKLPSPGAQ